MCACFIVGCCVGGFGFCCAVGFGFCCVIVDAVGTDVAANVGVIAVAVVHAGVIAGVIVDAGIAVVGAASVSCGFSVSSLWLSLLRGIMQLRNTRAPAFFA